MFRIQTQAPVKETNVFQNTMILMIMLMMMRMGFHLKSHAQALMLHFTISSPDRFHQTNHYRLNSRWAFIV